MFIFFDSNVACSMVDDASTDNLIKWSDSGDSFLGMSLSIVTSP
jgi:hypothetical protein